MCLCMLKQGASDLLTITAAMKPLPTVSSWVLPALRKIPGGGIDEESDLRSISCVSSVTGFLRSRANLGPFVTQYTVRVD